MLLAPFSKFSSSSLIVSRFMQFLNCWLSWYRPYIASQSSWMANPTSSLFILIISTSGRPTLSLHIFYLLTISATISGSSSAILWIFANTFSFFYERVILPISLSLIIFLNKHMHVRYLINILKKGLTPILSIPQMQKNNIRAKTQNSQIKPLM